MANQRIKKVKNPIKIPSAHGDDQPATRKIVWLVRDELRSDFQSLEQKMESRFTEMESRFSKIDSRFNEMEARFTSIDSRFQSIESRFLSIESKLSQMMVLLEEQNSNNRIVLEGLQGLWQRQERIESVLSNLKIQSV